VISEDDLTPINMRKVVLVASGCAGPVVTELKKIAEREPRLQLVVEDRRHGKADALNKIQDKAEGHLLVVVNSDASPEPGAISRLITAIDRDRTVGAISAVPVTEHRRGLTSLLLDFMWTTHNHSSLALNHMNLSNHSCDELVVFRSSAISRLPKGLVNDGAFLAATVRKKGYSVKVLAAARVRIETPTRIAEVIRQRRRILFGHAQVWKKVGSPPKTIESLLFLSPAIALRLLVAGLAEHPRFILALPLAAIGELAASVLAIWDGARRTDRHVIWGRTT